MRIDSTSVSAVALGAAMTAALLFSAVGVADPSPRIALADNTVSVDPPAVAAGDGSLADGQVLTPFDVQNPAVGRLDPRLLDAIQQAASAASAEGITMTITSGWRSPEFQQRLLDSAVAQYGSLAAAREYVQTPEASKHVVGEAVDVGGVGADQWLMANGARFGLCRIYANEVWHFELATDAVGNCPPLLPNAAG
ncbi:peptidase [Mycobacterium sp. ENV421]|uniref:M15 family metallopeptidase n=1 Tax=Mycobacterium sp. ENV421 TaxID=1213407 RepID=UPI000C9CD5DD|nr:M15 family metallopeptidase [Mycobacterium sp. ENV421]PND58986.1 peptidase [Mycobacterium sp. ENV421]